MFEVSFWKWKNNIQGVQLELDVLSVRHFRSVMGNKVAISSGGPNWESLQ